MNGVQEEARKALEDMKNLNQNLPSARNQQSSGESRIKDHERAEQQSLNVEIPKLKDGEKKDSDEQIKTIDKEKLFTAPTEMKKDEKTSNHEIASNKENQKDLNVKKEPSLSLVQKLHILKEDLEKGNSTKENGTQQDAENTARVQQYEHAKDKDVSNSKNAQEENKPEKIEKELESAKNQSHSQHSKEIDVSNAKKGHEENKPQENTTESRSQNHLENGSSNSSQEQDVSLRESQKHGLKVVSNETRKRYEPKNDLKDNHGRDSREVIKKFNSTKIESSNFETILANVTDVDINVDIDMDSVLDDHMPMKKDKKDIENLKKNNKKANEKDDKRSNEERKKEKEKTDIVKDEKSDWKRKTSELLSQLSLAKENSEKVEPQLKGDIYKGRSLMTSYIRIEVSFPPIQ